MMQIGTDIDYKMLYEQSQLSIASLQHELDQLKKMIFGSKHERFIPTTNNPSQLSLDIQAAAAAQCIIDTKKISYTKTTTQITEIKKDHPGRMKLPEHLERRERIIEPAGKMDGCKKIGEEVTEELEYEPGKLFVNRYVRPKYATPGNEAVIIAPMTERPLPKAIAGPGLLAQIVLDKYVDHLPLYRQAERFKREGINIPYSTITDWVSATCKLITPLYDALSKTVLQSDYLHADESPIKVLDKDKKGQTHRGYFWVYHNSIERLVLFDYRPGRGQEGPLEILKDFKGHLQTDGYVVYDFFKDKEDVTVLHCMAHARRMFFEAQSNDLSRATYAMEHIQKLYSIEHKAKQTHLDVEEVLRLRKTESIPILEALENWMKEQYVQTIPKSPIGKALGYSV